MKILIYSDNQWVIESIEKYIDFDYELLENIELKSLNQIEIMLPQFPPLSHSQCLPIATNANECLR